MADEPMISGVRIFPIELGQNRMILLKDEDHLLRRFGQVELRIVSEQDGENFTIRAVADEIWVPIEGSAAILLIDQRAKSPTENKAAKINFNSGELSGVLIPFGVAYAISTEGVARFMRLSTHSDGVHKEDQTLPAENFLALIADL